MHYECLLQFGDCGFTASAIFKIFPRVQLENHSQDFIETAVLAKASTVTALILGL